MPKKKAHRRVPTTEEIEEGSTPDEASQKYLDDLKSMRKFSGIVDRKGRIQFAADDAVKALGYTEEDILRKPFWEASWFSDSPESQRAVKQGVLDALAGQRVECRVQAISKEGTAFPVTFNISPLKGPEGAVVGIVAETEPLDLHEEEPPPRQEAEEEAEEKAEEKAEAAQQRLDSILNLMRDAYFETDSSERVTLASPSAARLLGYASTDQLVGRRTAELWTQSEDRDRFLVELSRKGRVERYKASFSRKGGPPLPVELDAHLLVDDKGEALGSQCIFRDTSETMRFEKQLKEQLAQWERSSATSRIDAMKKTTERDELEKQFALLAEHARDGIAIVQDDVIIFANYRLAELLGYEKDELMESEFTQHLSTESVELEKKRDAQLIAGEEVAENCQREMVKKDGSPLAVEFRAAAIQHQGRPAELLIISEVTDVGFKASSRRPSRSPKEAPVESDERFRTLIENASDAIAIIDKSGTMQYMSPSIEHMMGYTPAEVLGKNFFNFLHPKDKPDIYDSFTSFTTRPGMISIESLRMRHKDGSWRVVEGTAQNLLHNPNIRGIVANFRDITDIKQSEEKLRILFECAPDIIFLIDMDATLVDINQAAFELAGYTKEELVGKNALEVGFIAPEDSTRGMELLEKNRQGEPTGPVEIDLIRKDGTRVTVEIRTYPVDIHGESLVIGIARDMTERKVAEQALRESEEKYREVVERANAGIIIVQDGLIKYVNSRLLERAGYTPEHVLGTPITEYIAPDELPKVIDRYKRRMAGDSVPKSYETVLDDKHGRRVDIELSGGTITYQGRPADLIIIQDITERRQADEALRESEKRYRTIFDNPMHMIFINDEHGVFLDANDAALKRLGYTRDDLGKVTFQDILGPDGISEITQVMKDGKARGRMERPVELQLMTKSGEALWVETTGFTFTKHGETLIAIGIATDITERKQAEQALLESEKRFRTLIESASDAVSIVNGDGTIWYESPSVERVLGYKPEELVGSNVFDLIHPEDRPKALEPLGQFLKQPGAVVVHTNRLRHKDGSWRVIEATAKNLLDDPTIKGILSNYRDVTERNQAEQALAENEQRFRTLIENSSDAIGILDATGTIVYESPSTKRILGYQPEEMIGTSSFNRIHPDDRQKAIEIFGPSFINTPGARAPIEFRYRHKDGTYRWTEGVVQNLLNDPVVHGIVSNYHDITERKKAEEELRAYQERLKDALTKLKVSYEELSTPVAQLWDHVLAMPLVGVLDTSRAKSVMDVLLNKIVETRAEVIILDVTGVATMDTQVTNHLLQTAASTELLGAECVITGIKPEVAQAMVHIGVDISRLNTKRDLQEGLRYALSKIGYNLRDNDSSTSTAGQEP